MNEPFYTKVKTSFEDLAELDRGRCPEFTEDLDDNELRCLKGFTSPVMAYRCRPPEAGSLCVSERFPIPTPEVGGHIGQVDADDKFIPLLRLSSRAKPRMRRRAAVGSVHETLGSQGNSPS